MLEIGVTLPAVKEKHYILYFFLFFFPLQIVANAIFLMGEICFDVLK